MVGYCRAERQILGSARHGHDRHRSHRHTVLDQFGAYCQPSTAVVCRSEARSAAALILFYLSANASLRCRSSRLGGEIYPCFALDRWRARCLTVRGAQYAHRLTGAPCLHSQRCPPWLCSAPDARVSAGSSGPIAPDAHLYTSLYGGAVYLDTLSLIADIVDAFRLHYRFH